MTEIKKHTRTLDRPDSYMDLSEHVSWMMAEVVDAENFPMEITVTIEATENDRNSE